SAVIGTATAARLARRTALCAAPERQPIDGRAVIRDTTRRPVRCRFGAGSPMKIAYADPPYIGCAHLYRDHPDYAGEVDHARLIERLDRNYDGWILHAAATPRSIATLAPFVERTGARWMAWVKGFAAFKRNIPVAFAWE